MSLHKKYNHTVLFVLIGCISLLILQSIWVYHTYKMKHQHLLTEINDAFNLAYEKEQTYRIPVVDIINPGEVSIQGCGNEEIIIVRRCYDSDTIVYNNISGHSVENFINRVFWDLRESIVPMNIYCLADLFAGMLHDKNISVPFAIERYNIETGDVMETSLFPEKKLPKTKYETLIISEISDKEAIRTIINITPGVMLKHMADIFTFTICLTIIILICIILLFRYKTSLQNTNKSSSIEPMEQIHDNKFHIGKYIFDPNKNELEGFGEMIQLNKKENAILHALCVNRGNVVERNALLEENWGDSGLIYSRSLDTYLTTLRKYLKKDESVQIITIKGVGYKLVYP